MSAIELGRAGTDLRRNAIGVSHIVFFVVAAAAPLTAVVGASPAAFAFGNVLGYRPPICWSAFSISSSASASLQ